MTPSLTQRYAILAVDEKGRLSPEDKRILGGLVGCAALELLHAGVVDGDGKHVWVVKALPAELSYLQPLYDIAVSRGKIPAAQPLSWLVAGPDAQAHIDTLLESLFAPLEADGYVVRQAEGFGGKTRRLVPTQRGINYVSFDVVPQIKGDSELTPQNAQLSIMARKGHALRNRYDRRSRKEMRQLMDALPLERLTPETQEAVLEARNNPVVNAVSNPSVSSL